MTISRTEISSPTVESIFITKNALSVDLSDGRSITVPLAWFPRLLHGTVAERKNWRLIGKGYGIHWPDLDEDISVEGLLIGQPSGESQSSFKRWLEKRSTLHVSSSRRPHPRNGVANEKAVL